MVYITVKQSPQYHQMSLEELLFGGENQKYYEPINPKLTDTRTYEREYLSEVFWKNLNVNRLINILNEFNRSTEELRAKPRASLYYSFHIPKKSGGLRQIDAPNEELKDALYRLKAIFENDFGALYHTSAFAYIKNRSTLDCVKRHQQNESKWFCKLDLSNFFGSTTQEFVMKMFSMIFPFSEVVKRKDGKDALSTALSLAFLNGGLPQGTPISPLITNIMMIPVDFTLSNSFREFEYTNKDGKTETQKFVYTRYADDFQISSRYDFDFRAVENHVVRVLENFGAPFKINQSKTRYGSSSGRNWNLGVMLNKDNNITVGHRKKRQFEAMLSSFVLDTKNGTPWSREDIQRLEGYRNYYRMIEGKTIDAIVDHIGNKYNTNIVGLIKQSLA